MKQILQGMAILIIGMAGYVLLGHSADKDAGSKRKQDEAVYVVDDFQKGSMAHFQGSWILQKESFTASTQQYGFSIIPTKINIVAKKNDIVFTIHLPAILQPKVYSVPLNKLESGLVISSKNTLDIKSEYGLAETGIHNFEEDAYIISTDPQRIHMFFNWKATYKGTDSISRGEYHLLVTDSNPMIQDNKSTLKFTKRVTEFNHLDLGEKDYFFNADYKRQK